MEICKKYKGVIKFKKSREVKRKLSIIPSEPVKVILYIGYISDNYIVSRRNNSELAWKSENRALLFQGRDFDIILIKEG
ncbi:hypothetical protein VOWphi5012_082 [Vibrio phage phi50-12]|uniref:Uncharacterized protein n=1 Tax=Vibrio phage phi50-12 TaxID=2654972 RepID=A0A5P8PRH1_9CAUD|nr:hypothetical protein KNU82_gp082 [Vibrio phage phi50-12]QFR59866.1 hypothetical protein VOWphi5012_082 [Vibrio phage phi50-12]